MDKAAQFVVGEGLLGRAQGALATDTSLAAFSAWEVRESPAPILDDEGEIVGDDLNATMITLSARHANGRRAAAILVVYRAMGDASGAALDWIVGSARKRFEELHAET